MPQDSDALAGLFDSSTDTFAGGYANVPGSAPAFQAAKPAGAPSGSRPLMGAHRPAPIPDSYANVPAQARGNAAAAGNGGAPAAVARPLDMRGYNEKIRAREADETDRSSLNSNNDLVLAMHDLYNSENYAHDPKTQRTVRYIHNVLTRWNKYGVSLTSPMTRRGEVFDTQAVKNHFFGKGDGSISGATFGQSRKTGRNFAWPQDWMYKGMIWVCMRNPFTREVQFYSHVSKRHQGPGSKGQNFSHSSLSAGDEVIAAGEWIVEAGRLKKLSANSGHYQPTLRYLHQAAQFMKTVIDAQTMVYVYDSVDDQWVDYPALKFLGSPNGGGRYWAHPRAQG